jgi:hypothetical protein
VLKFNIEKVGNLFLRNADISLQNYTGHKPEDYTPKNYHRGNHETNKIKVNTKNEFVLQEVNSNIGTRPKLNRHYAFRFWQTQ